MYRRFDRFICSSRPPWSMPSTFHPLRHLSILSISADPLTPRGYMPMFEWGALFEALLQRRRERAKETNG